RRLPNARVNCSVRSRASSGMAKKVCHRRTALQGLATWVTVQRRPDGTSSVWAWPDHAPHRRDRSDCVQWHAVPPGSQNIRWPIDRLQGGSVTMKPIEMGIIGVGWIGEIRAKVCASHPLIEGLHLCEIDKARLDRVAKETGARTATTDYRELLARPEIDAIILSTTPRTTHYPFTRDCLMARKHVLLEKPIGLELKHA